MRASNKYMIETEEDRRRADKAMKEVEIELKRHGVKIDNFEFEKIFEYLQEASNNIIMGQHIINEVIEMD